MFYSIEEQIVRQVIKLPELNPQKARKMELLLDQAYHALQNKHPKLATQILQSGGALEETDAKKPTEKEKKLLSDTASDSFKSIIFYNPNFVKNTSLTTLKKLAQTNKEYRDKIQPILKAKRQQFQKWLASYGENYTLDELTNLKELNLHRRGITYIPPEIGLLTNLQKLTINYNRIYDQNGHLITRGITEIPPEIGLLTNLRELDLAWNQIKKIPPEIGQLIKLESLALTGNKITKIPPEIGKLTRLRELYLSDNFSYDENGNLVTKGITEIPPEIGLTNLKNLDLARNQITQIPPEIGRLTNLQNLYLSGNQITKIPPEIGKLTNLRELDLSQNQITELPPTIELLTNLRELDLSFTGIKKIPPRLKHINILIYG